MGRSAGQSIALRDGAAVVAVAVATAIRWLLNPALQDSAPFATYYIAAFLLAYCCGTGPAVTATLLGAVAADYFFIPPLFSLDLYIHHRHDVIWLALYMLGCAVAIVLIRALITARRGAVEAREQLRAEVQAHMTADAERERLLKVIDLDHDAIITATPRGVITAWSAGAERMYGWRAAEAVGQTLGELFKTDPSLVTSIERALAETGRWNGQVTHCRKDGREIVVDSREVLTRTASGEPEAILKVNRDITDRKRAEEQLEMRQKYESIGLLAAGMAHDINNLMTIVAGNCSLVLAELDDAGSIERVTAALRAANRTTELALQLAAYAGKGVVMMEVMDVNASITESSGTLMALLPRGCELKLDLDRNIPPIRGDRSLIQQAVTNLVVNAAEAVAEYGDGVVTVSTGIERVSPEQLDIAVEMSARDHVCLAVRDTGIGIDAECRKKIFDPFYSTKFLGRGLGLAAVAGIVQSHRGGILVESAPGAGSTFKLFFPPAV